MHITIQNDQLKVEIASRGAELQTIFNKLVDHQYLWNGDPEHWAKRSPILFPIVGELREGTYYYNDKAYSLSRHGFAREMDFDLESHTETSATFSLKSNEETLANYPFKFKLSVNYSLVGDKMEVTYKVDNYDAGDMYFSIGGHPAFALPMEEKAAYNEYYLEFNQNETLQRWPITDGLLAMPEHFMEESKKIPLSMELFYKDALVFKHPNSDSVTLKSDVADRGLQMDFESFPYLGIWAAPDAPFVCIEPWCGVADSLFHNQQLTEKEGINKLAPGEVFTRKWALRTF